MRQVVYLQRYVGNKVQEASDKRECDVQDVLTYKRAKTPELSGLFEVRAYLSTYPMEQSPS
jgi:hypothetical protein